MAEDAATAWPASQAALSSPSATITAGPVSRLVVALSVTASLPPGMSTVQTPARSASELTGSGPVRPADPVTVPGPAADPAAAADRRGHRAGSAGQRGPRAPLVHPHLQLPGPDGPYHLDIDALRKPHLIDDRRRGQVEPGHRRIDQAGQMRIADGDLQTTALDAADDRGATAAQLRSAHVYRDGAIGLHPDLPGPGPRLHLERRAVGQPMAEQVTGEHPDAVAAHLRDTAIRVAVVHEPAARAGADRPQDPVRAEPEAPVA